MGYRIEDDQKLPQTRLTALSVAIVLASLLLLLGFWRLQVLDTQHYAKLAEQNRIRTIPIIAARGRILDRNGRVLLDNYPSFSVLLLRDDPAQTEHLLPQIADGLGMTVEELITDNGAAYISTVHAIACRVMGIRHLRTRPRRPQTNGKAERFIRTMLSGWAYGAIYRDSRERNAALAGWLDFYNRRRPHGSLGHQPPLQRLEALRRNNLAGSYS